MKHKLKYFVAFSALFSISLITYGFHMQEQEPERANKYIGLGTVGLFLVAMPLFLVKESRGKSLKNYMLTKEKLEKMGAKARERRKY